MAEPDLQVSFDEKNRIRLLKAEDFEQTEVLATECQNFTTKIEKFGNVVRDLVEKLSSESEKIEQAKLLAIGQRNRVASEVDTRDSKQQELVSLINQKRTELERQQAYLQSLQKIEQEQTAVIEKLKAIE